ncbi:MAG: hypothetical protein KBD01_19600 [Acidobacteria bacterium]|nr:hypothetical protein [Acidobacteriota bacterium]
MKLWHVGSFLALALGAVAVPLAQEATALEEVDPQVIQQLLQARDPEVLRQQITLSREAQQQAEQELAALRQMASVARSHVDVKKKELSMLKERESLARKQKDDAGRNALRATRALEERQLDVFEAISDTVDALVDRAGRTVDYSKAQVRLAEIEMKLGDQRRERAELALAVGQSGTIAEPATTSKLEKLNEQIRRTARDMAEAARDVASKNAKLADAYDDHAKSQLELMDVWQKFQEAKKR